MEDTMKYRGIIIEESLVDNRILNGMEILKMYITMHENKNERWHLFEVEIDEVNIEKVKEQIIDGWYAHFWNGTNITAIFRDNIFKFNYLNKDTWKNVLEYGKKLNIPDEQMDFPIFGL
jgi:hypothetical protein